MASDWGDELEVVHGGAVALQLDGVGAHAAFDRPLVPVVGPFTIAVTFAARPASGYRELVSQDAGDGKALYLGRADAGHVRAGDDWDDTGVAFPDDDRWHSLVLVRGEAETVLYLDGRARARLDRALVHPRGGEFRIGRQYGPFEEFFAGRIAEVAVWRRALARAEVEAHVAGALNGGEADLHALVRLDVPGVVLERVHAAPARLIGGTWWQAPSTPAPAVPDFPAAPATCVDLWRAGVVLDGEAAAIRLFDDDLLVGHGRSSFTLEAWVRTLARGRRMAIFDFGPAGTHQGGALFLTSECRPAFELRGWTGPVADVALHDGLWHHVAVVVDDRLVRLYIDGRASGEAQAPAVDLRSGPATVGASAQLVDHFAGALAEVRAWSRAHARAEIETWRSRRPDPEQDGLAGWWPLASARNPGADLSERRRIGRAVAPLTALVAPPTAGPPGPVVALASLADVVAATPHHQLAQRLGGGVSVLPGVVVPVRVMLTPKRGALNPFALPGAEPGAQQDAAWIQRSVDSLWTDDVELRMDGPPVRLSLADLDGMLGDAERAAFSAAELAASLPIELRDVLLPIERDHRRLRELDLDITLRRAWDLGATLLGRPDVLLLRDPRLLVELIDPLQLARDLRLTVAGVVRLGSGDLELSVALPELVAEASLVQGTRIPLRELVALAGDVELPDGLRDAAIADLRLSLAARTREVGFVARLSDLWRVELAGREFAVRDVYLALRHRPGADLYAQLGGVFTLAGVPLHLAAEASPGVGWTLRGGIGADLDVDDARISAPLYLDAVIEDLLAGVGLPFDLPRIELTTLEVAVTPARGRVELTAAGAADVPLGGSALRIHEARVAYARTGADDELSLSLDVSASFEEILTLERFTLTFTYCTRVADGPNRAAPVRRWQLQGALRASMLGQRFSLAVSLFDDDKGRGLRFAAPEVALSLPLPLPAAPDARAALALRHLEVRKPAPTRDAPAPDWIAEVVVGLTLAGLPEPVLRVIPADLELRGGFKDGGLTLGISRLFAPQRIALPAIGPDRIDLGEMLIDLRTLSLTLGKKVALAGTLAIGLPSRINHLFGTRPDGGPATVVFRAYDPRRLEESITRLAFTLDLADGLAVKPENPPFEATITSAGRWRFDLGELGAIDLAAPILRSNGAGFHAAGELVVDPARGLWLPLTPLHELLRRAQLADLADRLPRRLRVDRIDLLDGDGRLDPARLLGIPASELPPDVRGMFVALGDLTEKLPATLRAFFRFELTRLGFALTIDAAGNLCFDLKTDPNAPVRALLPGFPFVTGVELRRLSFGPLFGGALFRLDVDADVHTFDLATLALAQLLPDDVMGTTLPARARLQRTLHLHDLFMVVVYQAGVPIPLPVFYTKLGLTYVGIEGIEAALQLYFNAPKLNRDDRPSIDIGEALRLIGLLGQFFRDPDFLLPAAAPVQQMNLILAVDAAYLKLPSYLGGATIGTREWTVLADAYALTAGVLNTTKTGQLRHVLAATPLARRIGKVRLDLLGLFAGEVGWVIATPAECATRETEVLGLLAERGAARPGLAGDVAALLPPATALARGDAAAHDPDGLLVVLRGAVDVGEVLSADSLVLLRAGVGGVATAIQLSARVAGLLALELRGLVRISDDGFRVAGATTMTMLGRRVLDGAFSLGDDHLALDGFVDLFPPGAPLAARGEVRGRLSRAGLELAGAAELSLLCFPLLVGAFELVSRREPGGAVDRLRLRATVLGAAMHLDVREEQGALVAHGGCAPITLGPLFAITGAAPGAGPSVALRCAGADASLTFDGRVELLGLSLAATIAADRDALRFALVTRFGIGEATLQCALDPQRGLDVRARFSLGVPGEQHAVTTIEDGKPVTRTFALEAGVTAQMWLRIMREPTAALLAERVRVHDGLVAAQRALFTSSLPTGSDTEVARAELAALRVALAEVRALHLGLTLPGPSRLPLVALAAYLEQVAALRDPVDRLLAQVAALAGAARDDERARWTRLRADLGILRQAVDRGHAEAYASLAEEQAFDAEVAARLVDLVKDGPAADAPISASRSVMVRGLIHALHARALYPEAPWRREGEVDGCAAFCDGATRRHADRVHALLTTLAEVATARDWYTANSASTRAVAYDGLPELRTRLPAMPDITLRLSTHEDAAIRLGEQRGLLAAAWGARHVAEAARARGDVDAAAQLQALDVAEAAYEAALADLRWAHEHRVLALQRADTDRTVDELRGASSPTRAVGGLGGAPFEDRPPAGATLAAIVVRSGARIDAIQCGWRTADGLLVWGPRRGGEGGAANTIMLADGEQVLELRGRSGERIDSLTIRTTMRTLGPFGGGGGTQDFALAPVGPVLGLHGRSGAELDAIGVIGPRFDLERVVQERGLAALQARFAAEEAARREAFERTVQAIGASQILLGRPVMDRGPGVRACRDAVLRELAVRPLDGWRLPFVGLATPAAEAPAALAPVRPAAPDAVRFGLALGLDFVRGGAATRICELTVDTEIRDLAAELPARIFEAVGRSVLGLRDDDAELRARLREHARRRDERRLGLAEYVRLLRGFHGLGDDTLRALLGEADFTDDEVAAAIA